LNGPVTTTANVTAGNILTGGIVSASGNVTGGNIQGGTLVSGTTLSGTTLSATGNVQAGNVRTTGLISATGNITAGNISVSGSFTGNINVQPPVLANITATGTYSLSTTNSINILVANNTGYTATLNMPSTPVNGQICNFTISGNAVTLAVGTGTVSPTFAGSAAAGSGYRFVYYSTDNTWYQVG
jgi:hypothetical protein